MTNHQWWKRCIAYQVYPRSFYDSNGDGLGDLPGVIQKLDYLKTLGIDLIWLNPVYASPGMDNGYDISDYQRINPQYGTMEDFERLVSEVHQRNMRLVFDLVLNHTSNQHPWFIESRKSRDNPFRDFYIWRDGKVGREPNNWKAHFAQSAWSWDELTGQYYLHTFSPFQPDLNWENPRLRTAIHEMIEWWVAKGLDGFRLDAISFISKAVGLPDHPGSEPYIFNLNHMLHGPQYHFYLQELHQKVFSKRDLVIIGECIDLTVESAIEVSAPERKELNMPFLFEHTGDVFRNGLQPHRLQEILARWQVGLHAKAWIGVAFGSHDLPRAVSMFGDEGHCRELSAKLIGTLQLTLEGTPFVYQGDEIGMTNVAFPTIESYRDIETLHKYREIMAEKGFDSEAALAAVRPKSRDNARTPMQWSAAPYAGFSTVEPWIDINPNAALINVESALADPQSVFYYYQRLIKLRKDSPALIFGEYTPLPVSDQAIIGYTRTLGHEQMLVILNCTPATPILVLPEDLARAEKTLLIGNYSVELTEDTVPIQLKPYEARVYRIWN